MTREQAIELFSGFNSPSSENGSRWDAEILFNRLDDPTGEDAVHSTKNLLLVSSRRKTKGVSYTALCAFFARPPAEIAETGVDDLVRTACRLRKLPAFVYAGSNGRLPKLPGTSSARQIAPADPGAIARRPQRRARRPPRPLPADRFRFRVRARSTCDKEA